MANTYTQLHIHAICVVKYRDAVIQPGWKQELYQYMTGVLQSYDHKMLQINGVSDHVHLFFGMRPTQGLSDLMAEVKESASRWINQKDFCNTKFRWQPGYAAFSHSRSQVPAVCRYIERQEEHHRKVTFREEYLKVLKDFEVDFDERYIFQPLE